MLSRDLHLLAVMLITGSVASLGGCDRAPTPESVALRGGDAERGKVAIQHYGCNACHAIGGLPEPSLVAAAPVTGIATRTYIAGTLPRTPENLMLWIRFPRKVKPQTAMPELGVSAADARDIATYLYSLR